MAYLDSAGMRALTIMPGVDFDLLDPTFVTNRLAVRSSEIDSMLRKRYSVPFASPVPDVVKGWLAAMVTPDLYLRRGWDPGSEQGQAVQADADLARQQIAAAADSKDGLWDLPLRADTTTTGVTSDNGPFVYSESSPYDWYDRQAEIVRGS